MILKYEVIKNGQVVHSGGASSEAEIHEQLKPYYDHKTFGEPEKTIQVLVSEEVPELREIQSVLVTPEVRDPETDEVITEAVYEDQEVITQEYAPAIYRDEVIPAEYTIEITDVTAEVEAQQELNEKLANGESIKIRCERAISLILDYNSEFTFEQIDQLEQDFGEIYNCLMRRRIDKAYVLITQTEPTDLISQEFLDLLTQTLVE